MVALLQQYSLSEILLFTIFFALAIKSIISFFDWAYDRTYKIFNREHLKRNQKQQIQNQIQHNSQVIAALQANQRNTDEMLKKLTEKIDMLIESDKDSIKSYITKEHHYYCYQVGWIDDFNLDCLERRYYHYEKQGGNSFIENFMNELRELPKQPQNHQSQ